ncbi:uncharacterized protein LOC130894602 isoform X2 [Diorhabda carinulata]|uniref:uncharacterized protein LOC130894602 isoform X2 n=1 Tax=Diorhabda carinulata TaxID=1163345 RepID=UPI0025A2B85B|nr:uncharacterized protein LOC130894602 isoform X2 [Diorhabda carinulata]
MLQISFVVQLISLILFVVCDEKLAKENEKTNFNNTNISGQERGGRQLIYYNPIEADHKRYTGWAVPNNKRNDNRYNPYNQLNSYRRQAFFPIKNRNPVSSYTNQQNTFQNRIPSNRRRPTVIRRPSGNIDSTRTTKKPVSKKKFKPSFIMM